MRVLEIYQSKQGEGLWTGQSSVFVRLFGCPLRCRFCDTVYCRNDDGNDDGIGADLTPDEIAGRVLILGLPHVVLTGGEPMQSQEIVELTKLLKDLDHQITIETSGIYFQPAVCDLMSISPKLSNTTPLGDADQHEKERSKPEIVQDLILRYHYQLKFVIDTEGDMYEVEQYLSTLHGVVPNNVLLMPQAVDAETMYTKAAWIEPFCDAKGYRYCPRMQLIWYGNKRRT